MKLIEGIVITAIMLAICALCAYIPWPICLVLFLIMGAFAL
jgi:hypothetical protein